MSERIEIDASLDDGFEALDMGPLLAAWPTQSPPRDFADRVMAACERADAEPAPRRTYKRPILLFAAAVAVAASLLLFTRTTPTVPNSAVWSQSDYDLGAPRD
jgi:hypothetical protein